MPRTTHYLYNPGEHDKLIHYRPHGEDSVHIEHTSHEGLQAALAQLQSQYTELGTRKLSLDLTRGKPSDEQLQLSAKLDGILEGNYSSDSGVDSRNYGGLEGLPEARAYFGDILGSSEQQTMACGNSSLTLMYQVMDFLLREGIRGPGSAWEKSDTVKFLCPSPGYDRHFAICEHLGITMRTVPMLDTGPDMDVVESLVAQDPTFKGMWCVPRFSNPTGCVYSDETVERIARLAQIAGDNFVVMWDNAYAVHSLYPEAPELASISHYCSAHDTHDSVFQFGSTSKVTLAGAGVAFMASSENNLAGFAEHLSFRSIGPDKVNQLRHLRFLKDRSTLAAHMEQHARILRPRFECVLDALDAGLQGSGMGIWTRPRGGYFISFETLPGLAKTVVKLAGDIGVKLTPAGASYPYGKDPLDSNIRLAPSFASVDDLQDAMSAFVLCVKLATIEQRLAAD